MVAYLYDDDLKKYFEECENHGKTTFTDEVQLNEAKNKLDKLAQEIQTFVDTELSNY
jgi:hypothetical protein